MASEIKLTVGGIKYTIRSTETPEYLNELGSALEERLTRIAKGNPNFSTALIAILAALEAEDEAKKAKDELTFLRNQIEDPESIQQTIGLDDKW